LAKITIINDCWIYCINQKQKRYGVFSIKDVSFLAHRVSWSIFKGKLDPHLVVDHTCRNRRCVNPDHLREVTRRVNALENNIGPAAKNILKTKCLKGHNLSGDNLYIDNRNGNRSCVKCRSFNSSKRNLGLGSGHRNRIKTHCISGHEYSPENTKIKIKKNGKKTRRCIICTKKNRMESHIRRRKLNE
jgi:hypothetical protein